jgi:hypothetical protein
MILVCALKKLLTPNYKNRHTGGSLGVYDKIDEMSEMLNNVSSVERLNAYASLGKNKTK